MLLVLLLLVIFLLSLNSAIVLLMTRTYKRKQSTGPVILSMLIFKSKSRGKRRLIHEERVILMIISDLIDRKEVRNRAYETKSDATLIVGKQTEKIYLRNGANYGSTRRKKKDAQ